MSARDEMVADLEERTKRLNSSISYHHDQFFAELHERARLRRIRAELLGEQVIEEKPLGRDDLTMQNEGLKLRVEKLSAEVEALKVQLKAAPQKVEVVDLPQPSPQFVGFIEYLLSRFGRR